MNEQMAVSVTATECASLGWAGVQGPLRLLRTQPKLLNTGSALSPNLEMGAKPADTSPSLPVSQGPLPQRPRDANPAPEVNPEQVRRLAWLHALHVFSTFWG